MHGIADSLENLAGLAARSGDPSRAPMLGGAAEALREEIGVPLSPAERERYERHLDLARSQLNSEEWDLQWAKGRAAAPDLEHATGYLLE